MQSELEKHLLKIKGTLYNLTAEQLIKVCTTLQISAPGLESLTSKTRSHLISYVLKYLGQEELASHEDEGMSKYLHLGHSKYNSNSPRSILNKTSIWWTGKASKRVRGTQIVIMTKRKRSSGCNGQNLAHRFHRRMCPQHFQTAQCDIKISRSWDR